MLRLNLGRPILQHIVRDLVGISTVGSSKGESPSSSHISKPRTPDCRKCPEVGPQHHQVSSGSSDLRGTRGTQLGHFGVSLIAKVNKRGLTPSICKRRKSFGNRHRVTARGHLGTKGAVQKGSKGINSICRKDHCDLRAPSDPTSILVFAWSK